MLWIRIIIIAAVVSFANMPIQAYAKQDEIYTSWRNNFAVDGYDVVSFYLGRPVRGKSQYVTSWNGALWKFSSQANLDRFVKSPEEYAPAYGGYCAWAVAKGKLARGKAKHWTLKDGKLYLNFNKKIKQRWLRQADNFIDKADQNWPDILEHGTLD